MGIFGYFGKKKREQEAARQRAEQERLEKEKAEAERREAQRVIQEKENRIQEAMAKAPGSAALRLDRIPMEVGGQKLTVTEFMPISKKRFVVFDLETTGLSSTDDAVVEIGAVRVEDGEITAEFHQLIQPDRPMPAEASAVNHITDSMLVGMPRIYEVLPSFLVFVGDDVLVGHNVQFDFLFLAQACMRNRFKSPERFFDTMQLARYWPEAEDKKLSSLIKAAGIENNSAHRALEDAKATAMLILKTNEKRKTSRKKAE